MNTKDFSDVNQTEENTAVDSGIESPLAREDAGKTEEATEANIAEEPTDDNESNKEADSLKGTLEKKDNEINELTDRAQRLAAEFDNFRKRSAREKERLYSDSVCDVVSKFLPVVDNLERAIAAAETDEGESLKEGISMILRQMSDILDKIGVKPIEALGKTFDPERHHAVMHIEDEDFDASEIIEEFQKGYIYNDETVIRYSMVKVAN